MWNGPRLQRALHNRVGRIGAFTFAMLAWPLAAFAASPWEDAVQKLETAVTGPIARGLSLVALVIGGLTWAFDEGGGSKRMLAGILFGIGMAVGAVQFYVWLFGTF